jgi:CheY-like chemotaxis protein
MTGTPTCLIVDDEPRILVYLRAVLQNAGFDTLEASNGSEALAVLRSERLKVEVVVSDVSMPVMSGLALAASVRAEFPEIPVILVSGYAAVPVEGIPLLQKPFLPAALLGMVRDAIESSRAAASA